VIAIGMIAAAVRWGVSGFAEDLRWVYLAQILHGVTVWGIILGAPVYVDAVVPARLRSTAQALLAMVGVSLGSILSNVGAGWLSDVVGPRAPAQVAGVMGLMLTLALPWMLPPTPRPREQDEAKEPLE
jgi:MFS family permease